MAWVSAEALTDEETPFGLYDRRRIDTLIRDEAMATKGGRGQSARNEQIRVRYDFGESVGSLAKCFGLSERQVLRIVEHRG